MRKKKTTEPTAAANAEDGLPFLMKAPKQAAVPDRTGFPDNGLVRLRDILAPYGPIPISKSSWWLGVRDGRLPQPVKIGRRITCWRASDINALIAGERG